MRAKLVRDWLNETAFTRCLKAKFFRIVGPSGKQLYDQLEARKYPEFTDITPVLRMTVTNIEETKEYFIVTVKWFIGVKTMRNDNYKSFIPTRMPNGMPYEFKFHHRFDEQDDYGKIKYIKECFNKILEENKSDIKALSELYVVLNVRIWFHYENGNERFARLYDEFFHKVKRYVYSKKANFSMEDLDYFFDFTD